MDIDALERGLGPVGSGPAGTQAAIDRFMKLVENDSEGPICYSYSLLAKYLFLHHDKFDAFEETLGAVMGKLLEIGAGGDLFFADGAVYLRDSLPGEFPELDLFRISVEDAFVKSPRYANVYVESGRFADLRSLSRMRRELKKTGRVVPMEAAKVVAILLGLEKY